MAKVEDRAALWLRTHPGSTLVQIARGIHASDASVRDALSSPLFTFSLSGKSYCYWLRGTRQTGRDEVRSGETDCQFLLRVLSDGQEHSLNEILRRSFADRGCGLTVHSRAADLRARGYRVENWKDGQRGDGSKYRMLLDVEGLVGEAAADPGSFPVRRSTVPTTGPSTSSGPRTSETDPVAREAAAGAAQVGREVDGQLTFATPEFRKAHAA